MYYVYELINLLGTVEYVGITDNPTMRKWKHLRNKPKPGCYHGKFYGRLDIHFHIVKTFEDKREALDFEIELQKFWNLSTHGDSISKYYKKEKRTRKILHCL